MSPATFSELLELLPMETAGDRRRRKLKDLCDEHGRPAVAKAAGKSPVYLEQIIKGVLLPAKQDGTRNPRNLGDSAARAIERAFDLPEGWFDAPDAQGYLSREARLVAEAYEKMTPRERLKLDHLMAVALDIDLGELELRERSIDTGLGELPDESTGTK